MTDPVMTPGPLETISPSRVRVLPPRPAWLLPATLEEAMRLCVELAKSELVPSEFRAKPANVFVAIQLGADLGLSPMQALQSIAVFNGKPSLYGDVGLALAYTSGLLEDFEEWYDEATQTAFCRAKRAGRKPIERSFGKEDAERAQVWNKSANKMEKLSARFTYQSYPRRMYQMRARWWALRDSVPDVFKGIVGREEIEDHADEPEREPTDMGPAVRVEPDNPFMPKEKAAEAPAPAAADPAGSGEGAVPGGLPTTEPTTGRAAAGPSAGPETETQPQLPGAAGNQAGDRTTVFEINGQSFATAGVTREQMLTLFRLCAQVNKKRGKLADKHLLKNEFGIDTRSELTEETAEKYRIRLTEILEA